MSIEQSDRVAPAYEILADDLRQQITSGRLRPGARLPAEPDLCARSGVSRSTVREALRLLASQHLIVTTRGVTGGSFVATPDPVRLAQTLSDGVRLLLSTACVGIGDLVEVREMLEVPSVGLAATRRTDQDLEALRATMFDPDGDDVTTKIEAHRAFHGALAAASGNALYELITRPLYYVANDRELVDLAPPGFWVRVDAEHREILRCVAERNVSGAQRATRLHLAHLRSIWADAASRPVPLPDGAPVPDAEPVRVPSAAGAARLDSRRRSAPRVGRRVRAIS